MHIWRYPHKENDKFTTTRQQLHNTPSHGVGPNVWGPPHLRGCCAVVVVLLCRNQGPKRTLLPEQKTHVFLSLNAPKNPRFLYIYIMLATGGRQQHVRELLLTSSCVCVCVCFFCKPFNHFTFLIKVFMLNLVTRG
jgi:hypothetical protein